MTALIPSLLRLLADMAGQTDPLRFLYQQVFMPDCVLVISNEGVHNVDLLYCPLDFVALQKVTHGPYEITLKVELIVIHRVRQKEAAFCST